MKNITIIVLSVLLAAAIIFGIIIYQQNFGISDSLQISHKKLLDSNEKVIPSKDAMIAKLQENLKSSQSQLKISKKHVSELDNALSMKDQMLSEFKEKLLVIERNFEEERKTHEALRTELSSRDAMIAKGQGEIEEFQRQLLDLKGQKVMAESKLGHLKSTYDALISDLNKQIESREVTIRAFEEKISVTFVNRVLFELGKATITQEGRGILKRVGEILKKVRAKQIRIIGHTDNIPILPGYHYKFPSNWELSTARAAAVVRYFQNKTSLDPKNLEAVGRSFYEPIASNDTGDGRAQNRRVNIIIAPKIE